MKVYAYSMVWDSGFAPAIKDGILSLACCKSLLRYKIACEMEKEPDEEVFIIGLCGTQMAKRHHYEKQYFPVYIAKITDHIPTKDYFDKTYKNGIYQGRPDCKYDYDSSTGIWTVLVGNPHHLDGYLYDPKEEHDLYYPRNNSKFNEVLLSNEFLYFGDFYASKQIEFSLKDIFDAIGAERKQKPRSDLTEIFKNSETFVNHDEVMNQFRNWFIAQESNVDGNTINHIDSCRTKKCAG